MDASMRGDGPIPDWSNLDWSLGTPYAWSRDRELVLPSEAAKGVPYECPECSCDVFLRHGEINKAHFAHHHEEKNCPFVRETKAYHRAKHYLRMRLILWAKRGFPPPEIQYVCPKCRFRQPFDLGAATSALPDFYVRRGLPDKCDIAILNPSGTARLVMMLVNSHGTPTAETSAAIADLAGVLLFRPRGIQASRGVCKAFTALWPEGQAQECVGCRQRHAERDARVQKAITGFRNAKLRSNDRLAAELNNETKPSPFAGDDGDYSEDGILCLRQPINRGRTENQDGWSVLFCPRVAAASGSRMEVWLRDCRNCPQHAGEVHTGDAHVKCKVRA